MGEATGPSDEDLKRAFKAFKKRMKLTQLDDDSKLSHGPMSKGGERVVSIQPPAGYGKEVWEALADRGVLKRDGVGFYEIVPGKSI